MCVKEIYWKVSPRKPGRGVETFDQERKAPSKDVMPKKVPPRETLAQSHGEFRGQYRVQLRISCSRSERVGVFIGSHHISHWCDHLLVGDAPGNSVPRHYSSPSTGKVSPEGWGQPYAWRGQCPLLGVRAHLSAVFCLSICLWKGDNNFVPTRKDNSSLILGPVSFYE